MELVKLTIDGQEVQVPAGTTVLEEMCIRDSTKRAGIPITTMVSTTIISVSYTHLDVYKRQWQFAYGCFLGFMNY